MNILGIETSGREGTLALRSAGQLVGEASLSQAGRRHAQTLVAELDTLIQNADIDYAGLDAVAVSIGPGSFTGLRVGVACAKTLAWATGCPIVAIDTLRVVAQNSPADVDCVSVISDAQRGDLFAAQFHRGDDRLFERRDGVEIVDAQEWCTQCEAGCVVTGPGLHKYAGTFDDSVRLLGVDCWKPLATSVALMGERQIEEDDTADLWSLEPLYIRRSAAEEKHDADSVT